MEGYYLVSYILRDRLSFFSFWKISRMSTSNVGIISHILSPLNFFPLKKWRGTDIVVLFLVLQLDLEKLVTTHNFSWPVPKYTYFHHSKLLRLYKSATKSHVLFVAMVNEHSNFDYIKQLKCKNIIGKINNWVP